MEPQKTPKQSFLSSLEREKGWYLQSNETWLYKYQGCWFSASTLERFLSVSQSPKLNLSSSHTLVCSFPKCGTTWLKALTFAVVTRSRFQRPSDSPLLTTNPHALVPFIELPNSTQDQNAQNLNVPLLSTHLPYACLLELVLDSDCKIIYICRDPKDVFVSRWHFLRKVRPANTDNGNSTTSQITLDQAFDLFCRGLSTFGPFWDHVLEYWKASLDCPDKVLFLKYESMMRDPISHVISIAKFMGYPFSNEEEMEGVPRKIGEMCNFESLSSLEVNKSETESSMFCSTTGNDAYFRKGEIGDWRNYLTQDMADKVDQITKMKLAPYGLHL